MDALFNYTADQWELYTCMEGAEFVAKELNTVLQGCFDNNLDGATTQKLMLKVMVRNADFGADDSEPHYHLREQLRKHFDFNA